MNDKSKASRQLVRWGAAVLVSLGSLVLTSTGCELVGPVVDGALKPSPSKPEPPPEEDCLRARQSYVDVLTGRVTFASDAELAAALDQGYAFAVAACGEGSVPPPPPVSPTHGPKTDAGVPLPRPGTDAGTPPKDPASSQECSDALGVYTKMLFPGGSRQRDEREGRAAIERAYDEAVAACGQDAVPPPPPFGN